MPRKSKAEEAAYKREYRKKHGDKMRAYSRAYRKQHIAEAIKYASEKYYADREKRLKYARDARRCLKNIILQAYGTVCQCCGESRYEFLSLDHINNDGATHRKELAKRNIRGGFYFYRWLIQNKFPPGLQVLCFNCNLAKGFHGYCPHIREKEPPVAS